VRSDRFILLSPLHLWTVTVPLFGIDVSNYQAGIDMGQAAREGFSFAFVKATEGSGYVNPSFAGQLAGASQAGMLVAAYHYLTTDPIGAQVANLTRVVPPGLPVIPDFEHNSGDIGNLRAFVDAVRAAGHSVPLVYVPQWYWSSIGSPDLSGLPPLWSSKYPTTNPAPASVLYQGVPQSYWNGYGGLGVAVLQFADSAQVAGRLVDASAYLGSRDQLAALLGGAPAPAAATTSSEESVATIVLPPTDAPKDPKTDPSTWPRVDYTIPLAPPGGWHGKVMAHVVVNAYYDHDQKVAGFVRFANWFVEGGDDVRPVSVADHVNDNGVPMVRFWAAHWGPAPQGSSSLVLNYAAPHGAAVTIEYER